MTPEPATPGFEFESAAWSCVILGEQLQVSLATCYLKIGAKLSIQKVITRTQQGKSSKELVSGLQVFITKNELFSFSAPTCPPVLQSPVIPEALAPSFQSRIPSSGSPGHVLSVSPGLVMSPSALGPSEPQAAGRSGQRKAGLCWGWSQHSGLIHQHFSRTYCVLGTLHETASGTPTMSGRGRPVNWPPCLGGGPSSDQPRGGDQGMQPVSQEPLGGGGGSWLPREVQEARGIPGRRVQAKASVVLGKQPVTGCGPVGWASWRLLYSHPASLPDNRCLARRARESWSLSPRITFQWEVQGSKNQPGN